MLELKESRASDDMFRRQRTGLTSRRRLYLQRGMADLEFLRQVMRNARQEIVSRDSPWRVLGSERLAESLFNRFVLPLQAGHLALHPQLDHADLEFIRTFQGVFEGA